MQLFLLTKKRHCSPLVKKFRRVFVTKFMKTCVEIVIGQNWKCQTILAEAHSRTVRRVNWSPCGNYLSSASFDGTVAIWDRFFLSDQHVFALSFYRSKIILDCLNHFGQYLSFWRGSICMGWVQIVLDRSKLTF